MVANASWAGNRADALSETDPPQILAEVVDLLLARKARTRELGVAAMPSPVRDFIDEEFALARDAFEGGYVRPTPDAITAAESVFRHFVRRFDR